MFGIAIYLQIDTSELKFRKYESTKTKQQKCKYKSHVIITLKLGIKPI